MNVFALTFSLYFWLLCLTTDTFICEQISRLEGHADYVTSVAWSPTDNRLASGSSDKTVLVWDAAKGEQVL